MLYAFAFFAFSFKIICAGTVGEWLFVTNFQAVFRNLPDFNLILTLIIESKTLPTSVTTMLSNRVMYRIIHQNIFCVVRLCAGFNEH